MKVREGFASNSSSSSFVIIGIKFSQVMEDDRLQEFYKFGLDDSYQDTDDIVIGKTISYMSDEASRSKAFDVEDLQKQIVAVKDIFMKLGEDPEEVKVYHTFSAG